jgi:GWxTD domain-containing protein
MTIAVEVKNSDVKGKSESDVTVLRIDKPLDISDIMLVSKKIASGGIKKIVPNISREITTRDSVISFYYEIYSDSNRNVSISYQIRNLRKDKFYKQKIQREIQKGKNLIYQSLSVPDFSLGDYSLIVKVEDEKSGLKVGIGKKFSSKIYSFPETIKDLDLAIDQMIYIASPSEIDYIKSAKTYDEKLKRYLRFWKSKDPTPNTDENEVLDEYYRRVDYANEHFKSYYDGWRTDMGMIYITLGPPDQVERHPFEFDSKPYEIWDYFNLNRRFVFVDQTGFGDYRLINPDFTDWRYRY